MDRMLNPLFAGLKYVISALLVFMTALVTSQVVLRATTGVSIKWAEEVSLIAFVWVTFLTLALGVHNDTHIRIDMFMARLPRGMRVVLEYLLNVLLLFVSVMMVWYGGVLTKFAMRSTMPATHLPTAVVYVAVPTAGVLCLARILSRLVGGRRSEVATRFIEGIDGSEEENIL